MFNVLETVDQEGHAAQETMRHDDGSQECKGTRHRFDFCHHGLMAVRTGGGDGIFG